MKEFQVVLTIETADGEMAQATFGRISESSEECVKWAFDYFKEYAVRGVEVKPVVGK